MEIPNVSYCENDDIVKYSNDEVIMTTETNLGVLQVCYNKGFCHNPNFMTKTEASKVSDIGEVFFRNHNITHFEELEYFTKLTILRTGAFQGDANLTSIKIPNSVVTIQGLVFQGTALKSIEIPSGVTSIGGSCFYQCPKLLVITSRAIAAPSITTNPFPQLSNNGTLYVPKGSSGYDVWMGCLPSSWTMVEI